MPKPSMQDSANFAAEFKALAERTKPNTTSRDQYVLDFCGYCTGSGIGDWSQFGGPAERFLAEFADIATRAGIALGSPSGVRPFNYFIDSIYNEFVSRRSSFAVPNPGPNPWFGEIRQACEAATTFWLLHKTRMVEGIQEVPTLTGSLGPNVQISWEPYYCGGVLLFRNVGSQIAKNVRLHYSSEGAWTPILSPQLIPAIPPSGHFRVIDVTKHGAADGHFWNNDFSDRDGLEGERASIAEFVHSLPSKQLTMNLVFEDSRGLERSREFRILTAGRKGYMSGKAYMEIPTIWITPPGSQSDESVSRAFMLDGAPQGPVSGIDASRPKGRQHGFPADMERYRSIAQIVGPYDEGWKDLAMRWGNDIVLRQICQALDKRVVSFPEPWKDGKTMPLTGAKVEGWVDALDLGLKKAIRDQIRYSLRMVLKP